MQAQIVDFFLPYGGFKKAERSADFPVRSNPESSTAPKTLQRLFFGQCCGLESPRSVLESALFYRFSPVEKQ